MKYTPEQKAEALSLYSSGVELAEIVANTGATRHTIRNWARAAGIDPRCQARAPDEAKAAKARYHREYYAKNKDAILERGRANYAKDIKASRARSREKAVAYRESGLAKENHRKWTESNSDKLREYNRIRAKAEYNKDPNKHRARQHNVRAGLAGVPGMITGPDLSVILESYSGMCVYCGSSDNITMDHLVPLSGGGHNVPDNIVPACDMCNCSKNDTPLLVWLAERDLIAIQ